MARVTVQEVYVVETSQSGVMCVGRIRLARAAEKVLRQNLAESGRSRLVYSAWLSECTGSQSGQPAHQAIARSDEMAPHCKQILSSAVCLVR